jgi:predicted DNA-binding transcriptional regulator AlpA
VSTAQIIAFPDRMAGREPRVPKRTVAAAYSCSTKTIERWMKEDPPVPHYREPGRTVFVLSEVEAWYQEHKLGRAS